MVAFTKCKKIQRIISLKDDAVDCSVQSCYSRQCLHHVQLIPGMSQSLQDQVFGTYFQGHDTVDSAFITTS